MRECDKKKKTSIAIRPRTLKALKQRAKGESRSLSSFLDWCFDRILEEKPQRRRRRVRISIHKGIIIAASIGVILSFSPAQMPKSRCKHMCLPPTSPLWSTLPHS